MNQTTLNEKTIKCKKTIVFLTVISLIYSIFAYGGKFSTLDLYFTFNEFTDLHILVAVCDIITHSISVLSIILLLIYVVKLYNNSKTAIIIPTIFSLEIFIGIFNLILWLLILPLSSNQQIYHPEEIIRNIIVGFLSAIVNSLAVKSALTKLSNKIFIVIPFCWRLILFFAGCYNVMAIGMAYGHYLGPNVYINIAINLIFSIIFPIALFLFCLKNNIPAITLSKNKTEEKEEKDDIEQALKDLKYKFDLGIITEEEYQAQKAEIIKNL